MTQTEDKKFAQPLLCVMVLVNACEENLSADYVYFFL